MTSPTLPEPERAGSVAALRPPARSLDPRIRRLWAVEGLIGVGVLAAPAATALAVATALGRLDLAVLAWSALAVVAAAGAVVAILLPRVRYRVFRWEVTPLGLYVQRGLVWRSWTIVPHNRIQTVETTVGPLERAYRLATVEVRTASGEGGARLPGLSSELVETLSADLAAAAGTGDAA